MATFLCTFSISFWPLLHLWTKIVEYLVFICNFFPTLSLSIFLRSWQSEQIKNIHIFFQQRLKIRITNPNSNNFQRINNLFFFLFLADEMQTLPKKTHILTQIWNKECSTKKKDISDNILHIPEMMFRSPYNFNVLLVFPSPHLFVFFLCMWVCVYCSRDAVAWSISHRLSGPYIEIAIVHLFAHFCLA